VSESTASEAATSARHDIAGLITEIGDVPVTTEPVQLRRKSRDYFWYSPILNSQLRGRTADVVAMPRTEQDVVTVVSACARRRVPLTVRGAGTGNYGQAVPLRGGVLLDLAALDAVIWRKPGVVRVASGARMGEIDVALRPTGEELRMHPSTKRSATIGGFIAGGSGGVGSVTYGWLREPGNLIAARIVTVEPLPRIIELRGDAVHKVNHAYGTTGIITELEMPVSPALPWIDVVVAFDDMFETARFAQAAAMADGINKKLLTAIAWPLPTHFGALRKHCPDGKHLLIAMVAEASLESFWTLLHHFRGEATYQAACDESPGEVPLYEYTWNHTTLQVLKTDRNVTYLQCLFPPDRVIEAVRELAERFGDEVMQHLEFVRFGGRVTASALPVVRYTSPARLDEIISLHEAAGVGIANPHVYTLEDGSRHKQPDADQLGFKHEVDPMGLLNPGKMRSFVPRRAATTR